MRLPQRIAIVALFALFARGALAADIIVSAAASLTNAFTDIGKAYEKSHEGIRVVFNFASSGALLQQISRGAPVDVFASADQDTMDKAAQQNLIVRGTRADFCGNRLVLVAPGDSSLPIASLQDLTAPGVARIGISDPKTVPVGKYAKGALDAAGLFAMLEPKFVKTLNVRQSLEYAARGEVEAAFVYATDAAVAGGKVRTLLQVDTPTPISYPIAVVKGNGKERISTQFVQFVNSPEAQQILSRYGFLPAP